MFGQSNVFTNEMIHVGLNGDNTNFSMLVET